MPKTTVHIVKKGESLDKIAKSYGIINFKKIYEDKVNAKFRKTRPNPNLIQPGDKIIIPNYALTADKRKTLGALINTIETRIKGNQALRADLMKTTKELGGEIQTYQRKFKKTAQATDAAATVLTLFISLGKIVSKGAKMAKMSASEVAKANKEILKEVVDMKTTALEPALQAGAQSMAKQSNQVVMVLGVGLDSFFNLTSPSFWGKTWIKARDEGMFKKIASGKFGDGWDAWSKAVTWDPNAEFDKMISNMKAQTLRNTQSIDKLIAADEALLKQLKGVAGR
ncbi:LysM peptidoglycan-binding domain-containing protein [Sulfitobacter geojensis]|uniref:LysM peptidoglycan-binding domain-containing protein n=1 Tax=Sulfitobacter geojensis TaxID=1342299 RepID=A0AAE2W2F5_9RHOB|nr:LysM domain-containing protein [Sulfitobacter geojensis]MBM1691581.1 LysM peptidoglycan-binding domain-containing protein [Sulfitobacter geojensis]MBM1695664.1 LysM peptidoglycan-binding domain-containing protein [Sulfitobacter geojensis]MBM1707824.1 LysM peptidoglycan-binding domain-containing protein [Sulfitobacter geojensis]MBM1711877.1 LysM peptidoglycan-binding domain-containing protein [Sulfitobacter geojensis]MBM1715944.1 LysM peptidoglycan-binding domain-containing protein [Sulfitob